MPVSRPSSSYPHDSGIRTGRSDHVAQGKRCLRVGHFHLVPECKSIFPPRIVPLILTSFYFVFSLRFDKKLPTCPRVHLRTICRVPIRSRFARSVSRQGKAAVSTSLHVTSNSSGPQSFPPIPGKTAANLYRIFSSSCQ
jgi:hypothetical protein